MSIYEFAEKIRDKNDFVIFLKMFLDDYQNNSEKWENVELDYYLEAMSAFLESSTEKSLVKMDFTPSWSLFAQIMIVASIYE